ncbi:MAG TPA: hypothetical protein VGL02_10290, partial [Streptomyces sp.]
MGGTVGAGAEEPVGSGVPVEPAPLDDPVGPPVAPGAELAEPDGDGPDGDGPDGDGPGLPDGPGDSAGVVLPWAGPTSRGGWTGAELGVDSSAA